MNQLFFFFTTKKLHYVFAWRIISFFIVPFGFLLFYFFIVMKNRKGAVNSEAKETVEKPDLENVASRIRISICTKPLLSRI